jgi:hypothetical protein
VPHPILSKGGYIILVDLLIDVNPQHFGDVEVTQCLRVLIDGHGHEFLQIHRDLSFWPFKHQELVGNQHGNCTLLAASVLLILRTSLRA